MPPRTSWKLEFDGSAAPNPGNGGWGCVLYDHNGRIVKRISARLGFSTSNIAEYAGLIGGMRACIVQLRNRNIAPETVELLALGDSELVCSQMSGAWEVRDDTLKLYASVARSLVAMFGEVQFRHVARRDNVEADGLAKSGAKHFGKNGQEHLVYYPSLCSMSHVRVHCSADRSAKWTIASNDMGTARSDEHCFIDAQFLASLSPDYLLQLRDPGRLSWLHGKVAMNVLGTVQLKVGVLPVRNVPEPPREPAFTETVNAVVVQSLPVPFHVSFGDPRIRYGVSQVSNIGSGFDGMRTDRFGADKVPVSFQNHQYWTSDVIFIGSI